MNGNIELEPLELRKSKTILFLKVSTGNISERDRPAVISTEVKSIDGTSNFDEFPESDILKPTVATSNHPETDYKSKDWVFINYTYRLFEGLTTRGGDTFLHESSKIVFLEMGS